ncbi:ATP-binding protein [Sneathiella chinensis]|uniref:Adenylate/guanylate cyclase domain-containing protein n=1 Tax=Sneathiella chinensis TaxID=349750 RepID=A0ABQ5U055_9PROT|nr:AAA family ATPase [Sneathiella chinensis]GLQ04791.1 adenylate/guanylate cyclase domain-containing protein [Sneathiella chinensis]
MDTLANWLSAHDLEGLVDLFAAHDITPDILSDLSDADLKEMGLSVGLRRRFRKALEKAPPVPSGSGQEGGGAARKDQGALLQAERRYLSVMFVDLVGSTQLSRLLDPEEMGSLLQSYQQVVSAEVNRFKGHVAKYMGDGVLAYFGWPMAHEDDVEQAVRAGLSILDAVKGISVGAGREPLQCRVGIATGLVVVGRAIGEHEAMERTVTGDTPNLAARLQQAARPDSVMIGNSTARLVEGLFTLSEVRNVQLKGFGQNEKAFEVQGEVRQESRFEARHATLNRIVGRDQELARLSEQWAEAERGEGHGVLVIGEAGIGKSRLLGAFLETLGGRDQFRIRYQCSPSFQDAALWPVIEKLKRIYRIDRHLPPDRAASLLQAQLGEEAIRDPAIVVLVAELLGVSVGGRERIAHLSAMQKRHRTLEALVGQVIRLTDRKPVLLVLEDAHWADPTTLELMELLLDRIGGRQVLVLMTSRPGFLGKLRHRNALSLLTLNRLDRKAGRSLIGDLAGECDLPDGLVADILSRTDGVPLFIEELTKSLLEADLPDRGPGERESHLDGQREPVVPRTLHDSLMARLDRLHNVKGIAQQASCIGREFEFGLVRAIADVDEASLTAALDRLVGAELLFQRGTPPDSSYRFKHALVRDAAYSSLLFSQRQLVHGRIARCLEADTEARPELVAQHAELAGDMDKAVRFYKEAGSAAASRSANAEAIRAYENALRCLGEDRGQEDERDRDRDREEVSCRLAMGLSLIAYCGYASTEVEENYQRARQLCLKNGFKGPLFTASRGLWNCIYDRGKIRTSMALAERLFDLAREAANPCMEALAFRALGSSKMTLGNLDGAWQDFDACVDVVCGQPMHLTLRDHGEVPQIVATSYQGLVACVRGDLDLGNRLASAGVDMAAELEEPIVLTFATALMGFVNLLQREYAGCLQTESRVQYLCREHGFVFWSAHHEVLDGCARANQGDRDKGIADAVAGIDNWRRTGAMIHVPTWSSFLADSAVRAGRIDVARKAVRDGLDVAGTTRDAFALAELQRLDGVVEARSGNWQEALDRLDMAIETAEKQGTGLFLLRAEMDRADLLASTGKAEDMQGRLRSALGQVRDSRPGEDYRRALSLLEGD